MASRTLPILFSFLALGLPSAAHAANSEMTYAQKISLVASTLDNPSDSGVVLRESVIIDNQSGKVSSVEDFLAYIQPCDLESVEVIHSTRDLPVMVVWSCDNLAAQKKSASFWIDDGKVVRINFNERPAIVIK